MGWVIRGLIPSRGKIYFCPPKCPGLGATQSSIQLVPVVLFWGVRRVRLIAYLHLVPKLAFLSLLVT